MKENWLESTVIISKPSQRDTIIVNCQFNAIRPIGLIGVLFIVSHSSFHFHKKCAKRPLL